MLERQKTHDYMFFRLHLPELRQIIVVTVDAEESSGVILEIKGCERALLTVVHNRATQDTFSESQGNKILTFPYTLF